MLTAVLYCYWLKAQTTDTKWLNINSLQQKFIFQSQINFPIIFLKSLVFVQIIVDQWKIIV